jgi:hypothetical protein
MGTYDLKELFAETKDAFIKKVLGQEPNTTPAPGMSQPATQSPGQNLADLVYAAVGGDEGKDSFISTLTAKFRASGFGQKLIEETKQQELQTYINDPKTWGIVLAGLAVLLFFGGVLGRSFR